MNARRHPTDAPMLYTIDAAADQLSLGRSTIYGLISSGQLRSVKVGSVRRVSADALRDYIAALEQAAS